MKNERKGFTLVELLLVLALIGIITTVSYSVFFVGQKSFEVGIDKGLEQEDGRILREYLFKEFRYVSYLENEEPEDELFSAANNKIYYSLAIKEIENGDGVWELIKIKYENGKEPVKTIFPIKFKGFSLVVRNEYIDVKIDSKYGFIISLENSPKFKGGYLPNDLNTIYYTYPEYLSIKPDNDDNK